MWDKTKTIYARQWCGTKLYARAECKKATHACSTSRVQHACYLHARQTHGGGGGSAQNPTDDHAS